MKKDNHIIVATEEGFCTGCGKKLVKKLWSNEEKIDFKTGKKYKQYVFTCPNLLN